MGGWSLNACDDDPGVPGICICIKGLTLQAEGRSVGRPGLPLGELHWEEWEANVDRDRAGLLPASPDGPDRKACHHQVALTRRSICL